MSKIKRSYQARGYCVQRNRGGDIHDIELRDSKSFLFLCHQKKLFAVENQRRANIPYRVKKTSLLISPLLSLIDMLGC